MHALQKSIICFCKTNSLNILESKTGVSICSLEKIRNGHAKNGKYRKNTIDILYDFFHLPKDKWYYSNMKKHVKPSESILGEILRKKRMIMCMSLSDVEKEIHVDTRQLARIEAGDSLPSFNSYTMVNLINLYDFSEEEREKIRWFISILRDLVTINNELE